MLWQFLWQFLVCWSSGAGERDIMPRTRAGRAWAPDLVATYHSCLELVRDLPRAWFLMRVYPRIAWNTANLAYIHFLSDPSENNLFGDHKTFREEFVLETGRTPSQEEEFAWFVRQHMRVKKDYEDRAERSEDDRRSLIEGAQLPVPNDMYFRWTESAKKEKAKHSVRRKLYGLLKTAVLFNLMPRLEFLYLQASAVILFLVLPRKVKEDWAFLVW